MSEQIVAKLVGYVEARGVGEYSAALKAAGAQTTAAGKKIDESMSRAKSSLAGVRREAVTGAGGVVAYSESWKSAGLRLKESGARISAAGQSMRGASLAAGIGVGYAVKRFGEFDATMRQVGAVAGATGAQMRQLNALALKMGADTSFSAKEAADAMLELARGGMTRAQIKAGALKSTLTLAAAGGLELGAAATYMTNTLNAFGLSARDANAVAAALAGGANASTASVESLGMGLAQVSAGARNAGLSMNETVGVLALFDQAGVKGSDAGTSLKTMLQALTPNSNEAAAAMRRLGLDFTDARGRFLPIAKVADQLRRKLGGLSEAQRNTALETIFGADAARAASILMRSGAAGVDKYTKATKDLGAAQRLAKTNTSGQAGALERMRGSIETAAIAIGTGLAPTIIAVAGVVEKAANAFGALPPRVQKISGVLLLLAAAAAPVLMTVGAMVTGFGAIAAALGAVSAPVLLVAAGATAAAIAFAVLYRKSSTVRAAVGVLWSLLKASPLGMVVRGVGMVVEALGGWRVVFLRTKLFFLETIRSMLGGFQTFARAGSKIPGDVGASFRRMARNMRSDMNAIDGAIVKAMTDLDMLGPAATRSDKRVRAAMARSMASASTFAGSIRAARRTWDEWNPRPKRLSFAPQRGNLSGNPLIGSNGRPRPIPAATKTPSDSFNWRRLAVRGVFAVPALARGGIVSKPTTALIGEAGPEAVIPLDKLARMIDGKGAARTVEHHWHVSNPVEDIPALMGRIDWYSRTRGWA